jgi:hypothetical protein
LFCQKDVIKLESRIECGGGDWRDGLAGKNTDYSFKGPEFKSQQPYGGSLPLVMRSDAFFWCV